MNQRKERISSQDVTYVATYENIVDEPITRRKRTFRKLFRTIHLSDSASLETEV